MTGVEGIDEPVAARESPEAAAGTDEVGGDVDGDAVEAPRGRRTGLVVSAAVAAVLLGFVFVLATREPATDREADSPLVGRAAPSLTGSTLDGSAFDIDDHIGRWVVVNVFATWCVPCQQEHPELDAFDQAHRRTGDVRLVSVLYDDEPDDARDYFERHGGDWPVVLDEGGRAATAWSVSGVPETYVVSPTGVVVAKLIGGVTAAGLDNVIADVSGESSGEGS